MADQILGISPQVDTHANWVSNNPTLGKNSGGKSYGQIILSTSSPVGDIMVWGNAQTYNAAYAAGQYGLAVSYAGIASQTVSTTSTVTLGATNHLIELDTSGGDITATLPSGDFTGQQLDVYTTGSNIAQIAGTGLYTNNIYQTSNTGKLNIKWNGSGWVAGNYKTAEVDNGDYIIEYYSNGAVVFVGSDVGSTSVSSTVGSVYYAAIDFTFPITMAAAPSDIDVRVSSGSPWPGGYANITTTTVRGYFYRGDSGGSVAPVIKIKGYYA